MANKLEYKKSWPLGRAAFPRGVLNSLGGCTGSSQGLCGVRTSPQKNAKSTTGVGGFFQFDHGDTLLKFKFMPIFTNLA